MVTLSNTGRAPEPVRVRRTRDASDERGPYYEFRIGSYAIYHHEYDSGLISQQLLASGYDFTELQPVLNAAQEQFQALQEHFPGNTPAKASRGRNKPEPEPEGSDDAPASA